MVRWLGGLCLGSSHGPTRTQAEGRRLRWLRLDGDEHPRAWRDGATAMTREPQEPRDVLARALRANFSRIEWEPDTFVVPEIAADLILAALAAEGAAVTFDGTVGALRGAVVMALDEATLTVGEMDAKYGKATIDEWPAAIQRILAETESP